ncbi:Pao retrotransposon peptidase family protein [Dirofilaria immitis]|nr:Pao retrotransposon peptidase family protein [Dirofilaria immitis]
MRPQFWNSFNAAIHRQGIPNIQKLTYLISRMKGEALESIKGYDVTSEKYGSDKGDTSALFITTQQSSHPIRNAPREPLIQKRLEVDIPIMAGSFDKDQEQPIALDDEKTLEQFKQNINKTNKRYQEQMQPNIVREVKPEMNQVGIIHYLPHHEVLTPSKSITNLRIVYDALVISKADYNSIQILSPKLMEKIQYLESSCIRENKTIWNFLTKKWPTNIKELPRFLLAILIGVREVQFVINQLEFENISVTYGLILNVLAPPQGGQRGLPGRRGRDGSRGIQGEKGDIGAEGEEGEKGIPGIAGPPGEEGDLGDQGAAGDQGLVGIRGMHVMGR